MFVLDCATPCKFLGNSENESQLVDAEKTPVNNTFISEKTEENNTRKAPATCCAVCNAEMSQTSTKFRIDGWKGTDQKLADDDSGEVLAVIVYLCPICGKIDFRADEKLNKN